MPADHTIRTMLSICLRLLLESESARSLFISVPASPLSRRRERSAGHPAPFQVAFSQSHKCLRTTPPTPFHQEPSAIASGSTPPIIHIPPETACPAATQIRCRSVSRTVQEKPSPDRNKSVPERRAVSSYSFETAPGKPCADSHSVSAV